MNNSFGACIIVKDAEKTIGNTLESIFEICSQIVVIDTGSIDNTPQICTNYGAEVHFFKWVNDFSKARNYGLDLMRTDWILTIDSDEIFEINNLNLNNIPKNVGGLNLEIINFTDPNNNELALSHYYTRIFRNNKEFRFSGTIHEQIRESIELAGFDIIKIDSKIHHFGYSQPAYEKKKRNKEMLELELNENENDFLKYHLANTEFSLNNYKVAQKLFYNLVNSSELSENQIEHIKIRLAQIALLTEDFAEIEKWTSFSAKDTNIEGLKMFIIASLNIMQKQYKNALVMFNSPIMQKSSLVDKNVVKNAIEFLTKML